MGSNEGILAACGANNLLKKTIIQDSISFDPLVHLLDMFRLCQGSLMSLLSAVQQTLLLKKKEREEQVEH